MKKVIIILFLVFISAAFAGMELIDIIDWGGPCAIATRDNGDGTEWVVGAFRAGIQTYLINSLTSEKMDSGRVLYPEMTYGLAASVEWRGDSLFCVYGEVVAIYDLINPRNPDFLLSFPIADTTIRGFAWGNSAIYIVLYDKTVLLLDPIAFQAGIASEIAHWDFEIEIPNDIGIYAQGDYLYIYTDTSFSVVKGCDSIPNIVFLDTLATYYTATACGDTVIVICLGPELRLYRWEGDSLIGPVLTTSSGVFWTFKTVNGRNNTEFWNEDDLFINRILLHDTTVIIEPITYGFCASMVCSNSGLYISYFESALPALSLYNTYTSSVDTLKMDNQVGPLIPIDNGFIKGGRPLNLYYIENSGIPKKTASIQMQERSPYNAPTATFLASRGDTLLVNWRDTGFVLYEIVEDTSLTRISDALFEWGNYPQALYCPPKVKV